MYQPIEVAEDGDGILRGYSDALGLDICVLPDLELRLYDPEREEWLLNYDEEQAARQAAELQAQAAELQAQLAERDAQIERDARQAAEERIRELEALLRAQDDDSFMTLTQGMYIVVGAATLLVFLSVMVLALTWLERKALARIQMRMGPYARGLSWGASADCGRDEAGVQGGHPAVLGG